MVTEETSKLICEYFKSGKKIKECVIHFSLSFQTIVNHLKKNNIKYNTIKDKSINKNFFEKIDTEAKSYFLGFLLADGCIHSKKNKISFTLNSDDYYILEILKKEMNSSNQVRFYNKFDKRTGKKYSSSFFNFNGKKFKDDLLKHGIEQDKTKNFIMPKNIPINLYNHFLRGLFDGDGHVSKTRTFMSFISTYEFLNFININFINNVGKIREIQKNKNVYRLEISEGKTCEDFLDYMYKNATIFLKRKYDSYLNLKKFVNTQKRFATTKEVIVFSVENNRIINKFESSQECALYYNISSSYLSNIIKNNKTINGLFFEFGKSKQKTRFFNRMSNFKKLI